MATSRFEQEIQKIPEEPREVLLALMDTDEFKQSTKDAFQEHDEDKNGHIDEDELRVALENMYDNIEDGAAYKTKITDDLVKETFTTFDTDKDGTLDESEFAEFCKVMTIKLFS